MKPSTWREAVEFLLVACGLILATLVWMAFAIFVLIAWGLFAESLLPPPLATRIAFIGGMVIGGCFATARDFPFDMTLKLVDWIEERVG